MCFELEDDDLEDSTTYIDLGVPRACRSGEGMKGGSSLAVCNTGICICRKESPVAGVSQEQA